jgi:protoheme IX farnesyltransferase
MTRPRVLLLVLFTGLPVFGMTGRWPGADHALAVLFGAALAGAACSTLNAWFERETDARMARTRHRPLPAAAVQPGQALGLGLVLTFAATTELYAVGGTTAAIVALGTIVFYVGVYTMWLKPRTPQNIVIGGAAGATTPMIVEAALTGRVGVASIFLFLLIFLWTPPHFWAIAIFRKEEYADAGFPMMPLVVGDVATRQQSFAYALVLLVVSLSAVPLGLLGPLYGVLAMAAGVWFVVEVAASVRRNDPTSDYRVFRISIAYLFILFGAMILDLISSAVLYAGA